ncbi:hypothetical protein SO802_008796 [Lithocarpus litseifolius]|uniref:Mediator of RNA polymerase II transcription subunit 15a-like n=1 Tax=Lithocarpus litseifolius TaxID=425828 RepID=A0AAW2DB10_9ROSI
MQTKSSVGSDHPQRQKSSCQVFSQHPHLVMNHPNLVLNQPQQTQQAPVNKSQPSLASHQQQQLKNTNLAATSTAQNQQSNLSNTHQQQLSRQSNFPSLQPCQQLCAKQCGNSSMLQTKDAMERQTQQIAPALVPTQGQQSEPKLPQSQLISQSQQKQMQQPPNPSQVVMGNFQTSGAIYSTSGKRFANISDLQEDAYQRVEQLRSRFLKQLNGWQQLLTKRLQLHASVPQQPKTGQSEKIKTTLSMLDQIICYLNVPKNKITCAYERQIDKAEKRILCLLHSLREKSVSSTQQGKSHPNLHSVQHLAQPQSQTLQVHQHEDRKTPQLQSTKPQSSLTAMQQNNLTGLLQDSKSSLSDPATLQQNMMNSQGLLIISQEEDSVKSMQQVANRSLQSPASTLPQVNVNSFLSRRKMNGPQSNVIPLESSSNTPKNMHLKQKWDHQDVPTQMPKQEYQKHKMQKQLVQQNQQILQQQQRQVTKLLAHEKQQNQLNDINDLKGRLGMGVEKPQHQEIAVVDLRAKRGISDKSGLLLQHPSGGQSSMYISQHSNSGASIPTSSPKVSCPQLAQKSPHIDVQNLTTPLTGVETPFHVANTTSASVIPSSSLNRSCMPGNAGKIENQLGHSPGSIEPGTSLVVCTREMSASPVLEKSNNLDGINYKMSKIISAEPSVAEQPIQRLINLVNLISSEALSASVSDIGAVVCMTDQISSSPPANGTRKMKRCTNAMPINDSFEQWIDMEKPELESSVTSSTKRPRIEAKHALFEEIMGINQQLIDTVVVLSDEDTIPTAAATAGSEGTIVKCSLSAVSFSPNYKSQQLSTQMSPIEPLRLLVPTNYPYTSPIFLDKMPVEAR